MNNYVTLLGAEAVQNAGHQIQRAAEEMRSASGNLSESLRHGLLGFEAVVDRMPTFRDLVLASCLHAQLNSDGGDSIGSCLVELGLPPETTWDHARHWPLLCLKRAETQALTIFSELGR